MFVWLFEATMLDSRYVLLPLSLIDIPNTTRTELPQPPRVADLAGGNAYIDPRGRVAGTPSI